MTTDTRTPQPGLLRGGAAGPASAGPASAGPAHGATARRSQGTASPRGGAPGDRVGPPGDRVGPPGPLGGPHRARVRAVDRVRAAAGRALGAVTTPLLPADYLDVLAPLHAGPLRGRIEQVLPETPEAATLVIRPGRAWQGHMPGQYVRLGVDVDGVRLWRAYSVTSGPRDDGRIAITVKVIPGGRVSTYLVRSARPGQVVQLDQATGDFGLPRPAPERVLFVTAGSGITPVMGILRHRLPELRDVVVVHSAPTPEQVIFGDELRRLAGAGSIRLVERHTDRDGLLGHDDLARLVPDWAIRQSWACGPTPMLDELEAQWAAAGVDALHTERFRARIAVTGSGGEVSFARSGVTTGADGATPLLDVGEGAGVLMRSGCRMGICFACVVPLESGAVRDLRSGVVTAAEPGDGVQVQACVSAAAGTCRIGA